jgi:hypothetical protein
VANGGIVRLNGPALTITIGDGGASSIKIGNTAAAGSWTSIKAVGGGVTLGANTIAGTESAVFTLTGGTPGITVPIKKVLKLNEVELNLVSGGVVSLAATVGSDVAQVSLVKSQLTLDSKAPVDNPLRTLNVGLPATTGAKIIGIGAVVKGASNKTTGPVNLVSLADNTVNPLIITGAAGLVNTILKGTPLY